MKFANEFLEGYLNPAFGSHSKSETDLLDFSSLISAGVIESDAPFSTLLTFSISPQPACEACFLTGSYERTPLTTYTSLSLRR